MIFALFALWLATLAAAIHWSPLPWHDHGDCRGIVWHTVRIPSTLERFTLWQSRYYLLKEYPPA